ncbi:MAG TPA: hypothetical protein ENK78_01405 [Thiothrix sp.]|nr:hypothetical protein [Thiothrix sp.]
MLERCQLRCPMCGHQESAEMPDHLSPQYYRCSQCKQQIRAPADACCIFCAYGDLPCPTAQIIGGACCSGD